MHTQIIELNNRKITCKYVKRKNSKKVRISIKNKEEVNVSLPYYCTYFEAKLFVKKNRAWIKNKLNKIEVKFDNFYYLGNSLDIEKKFISNYKSFNYILEGNKLTFETKSFDSNNQILFNDWLKIKAREYIPERVDIFAKKYNFSYNNISIKNLRSRWGSCSSNRNLSFNQKLMCFKVDVIDYVIIHELCHLVEMNHSKQFWNLVSNIIPDYKRYRKELNTLGQIIIGR